MAQIELINSLKEQPRLFTILKSAWYQFLDSKWCLERALTKKCQVCNSRSSFDRIAGYGRIFLKCRACSHIWAHDYSRMRALIGMGMNDWGVCEADTGGETEMFLARFCKENFGSRSVLLFGTGPTRAFRELHNEGYDVFGCDVSADVIKFRQAEFGADRFFHANQLGDMKFDVIISTEVIEHLFDPVDEMKGIVNHCERDGIFCGSTGFSKDGGVDEGPNRYMAPRGHVIYWSERSLKAAFGRLGLTLTSFPLGSGFSSARVFFGSGNDAIISKLGELKKQHGDVALFQLPGA
jgi:SAM-dependent methyltransferase